MKAALLVLTLSVSLALLATARTPTNPLASATPTHERFTATIDEQLPAGGYTYVRVRDAQGRTRWVATLGAPTAAHDVTVELFAALPRFESPRLHRTFTPLSFGRLTPHPGAHP